MAIVGEGTKDDPIILGELTAGEVKHIVPELRPENFFDLEEHPFEHIGLIDGARSVVDIIGGMGEYADNWLAEKIIQSEISEDHLTHKAEIPNIGNFGVAMEEGAIFKPSFVYGFQGRGANTIYIAKDAVVAGADIYLNQGDIYIGEGTVVEPGAGIKGPTIIGKRNEIRQGAYLRGNVIIGNQKRFGDNAIRGELKNDLMLDEANFPHSSYLGDSVCGYNTHMGNIATAANLGIIQGVRDRDKRVNLKVKIHDKWYDLGRPKMGAVLGDKTQLGCGTVVDPGTLFGPMCISYGAPYIESGYYPPCTMFKARPEKFVDVQRGKFDPRRL